MFKRGGNRTKSRHKRLAAWAVCLLVAGGAYAGWRFKQATDPSLVDPIPVPADIAFQSGDIIVAGGVSLQSRVVRSFTEDNRFSHVGMIEVTPDGLYVIHAAPEGEGDGGVGDKVARIPLSLFLAERGYVAIRVMRLSGEAGLAKQLAEDACAYASACVERAVPFDGAFDLAKADTMYCSELIYLAYQQAGHTWPDTMVASVSTLLVDGPVILPDAFTECSGFETVWQH